jgi:HAMP domain
VILDPVTAERKRPHLSLRWKLLAAFTAAFTVVFVFIALWVVHYAGATALTRVKAQLIEATEGTARDLPVNAVEELVGLPAGTDITGNRYYRRIQHDLRAVQTTLPRLRPYLVARADGETLDYLADPGGGFRAPVLDSTPQSTIDYMLRAFDGTIYQGRNDDDFGQWVSAYSPVIDRDGQAVAIVGMDFPLDYVRSIRTDARKQVFPILIAGYVGLIGMVLLVSTLLVRPIERMTTASKRIADGDYELDLTRITRGRYPDELSDLADSFQFMAAKVAARERELTQEVHRLQVQIDTTRREESVKEITETEFFTDLQAKAAQMRARMRER